MSQRCVYARIRIQGSNKRSRSSAASVCSFDVPLQTRKRQSLLPLREQLDTERAHEKELEKQEQAQRQKPGTEERRGAKLELMTVPDLPQVTQKNQTNH